MVVSINSNNSSLNAQRQLGRASDALASTSERLSSGLRINKASDDAAGLQVASSLRNDGRVFQQGVRNFNDGLSLLSIADASLDTLSQITVRLQELATQAANGTLNGKQRNSIDAEAQALAQEYFRTARTTKFGGQNIFDGSIQGLTLQGGYGSNGGIRSTLGGALGTGTVKQSGEWDGGGNIDEGLTGSVVADINGDGFQDLITAGGTSGFANVKFGNGDGTFRFGSSFAQDQLGTLSLALADLNNDGTLDLVTVGTGTGGGSATIRLGNSNGTFKSAAKYTTNPSASSVVSLADVDGDGNIDLITGGNNAGTGYTNIRLGNGNGTFKSTLTNSVSGSSVSAVSVRDINGDGILDVVTAGSSASKGYALVRIGNGDGTFKVGQSYQQESQSTAGLALGDFNGDGVLDILTAGSNGSVGYNTVRFGNGDGTFKVGASYQADYYSGEIKLADFNGDGILDYLNGSQILAGNGNGTFKITDTLPPPPDPYAQGNSGTNAVTIGDLNNDGVPDIITVGFFSSNGGDPIASEQYFISNTQDGVSPLLSFSFKSIADARQAIPQFSQNLQRLSYQRSQIGAFQSRLSSGLNVLRTSVLESAGALSRIEDTDVAQDTSNFARQSILQLAGVAVLAQANIQPQIALQLLNGRP